MIQSHWRIFESNWLDIDSQIVNLILNIESTFRSKWLHFLFQCWVIEKFRAELRKWYTLFLWGNFIWIFNSFSLLSFFNKKDYIFFIIFACDFFSLICVEFEKSCYYTVSSIYAGIFKNQRNYVKFALIFTRTKIYRGSY